jgi:flagellar hook-basal body complex protein FliE
MASPSLAAGAYAAIAQKFSGGAAAAKTALGPTAGDGSFSNLLTQAIGSVAETGQAADLTATKAAVGRTDLIDVVTAVAESETAIQTLVSVRDRVISAYEEIMRMPI